jgi:cbb3-type cytochrome oxidase cytochrome c subunit
LSHIKTNNTYKKINLPKAFVVAAGASAMILSTGFVSGQTEATKLKTVKLEQTSSTYGRDLYTCEGTYGNCLPTVIIVPDED